MIKIVGERYQWICIYSDLIIEIVDADVKKLTVKIVQIIKTAIPYDKENDILIINISWLEKLKLLPNQEKPNEIQ